MERPRGAPDQVDLLPLRNPTTAAADAVNVRRPRWPTIDGPLGLSEEDSVLYARRFYKFGFLLLPWLWAVNCLYFWPVLRHSRAFPDLRKYVLGSAIGFTIFAILLSSWSLTFMIGGEPLFGSLWDQLVMYNVADAWGLTGWM
ncbi:hypothetical protein V2J09_021891 [Rumex salicifolius]